MDIKALISQVVNEHQGIKATELAALVVQQSAEYPFNFDEYDDAVTELIREGEIIEVEYTLPSLEYRIKSWYLPKDTVVIVSKAS